MSDRISKSSTGNIMLAVRKPGQVAAQPNSSGAIVFRGSRSGNSNFDPKTGQFAGKGKTVNKAPRGVTVNPVPVNRSGIPQGVTQEEWERRMDTVRDAARTAGAMTADEVTTFLKNKVGDLSKVDVNQFVLDVRAARLDDLADALQSQYKNKGRGQIKVVAPKSYFKSVFTGLTDDEAASLIRRMQSRGWTKTDIKKNIISTISDPERKKKLEQTYGEVKLGEWPDEPEFALEDEEPPKETPLKFDDSVVAAFKEIASNMPAPIINVQAPAERTVERTVVRGKDGLITGIREEHHG